MPESDNPYAAPQAAAVPARNEVRHYGLASPGQRFLNLIIDYLGMSVLTFVLMIPYALIWPDSVDALSGPIADRLVGLVVMSVYYLCFETLTGRTLGKLVTRTKVINAEGGRPSAWRILRRTLARIIPFEAFSFFRAGEPGLHDRLSKTCVVRLRPSSLQRAMAEA